METKHAQKRPPFDIACVRHQDERFLPMRTEFSRGWNLVGFVTYPKRSLYINQLVMAFGETNLRAAVWRYDVRNEGKEREALSRIVE